MADLFRFDLLPGGGAVLCALSGGADSMYLLCRLLEWAAAGRGRVAAAHYNHRLRPTAGRDEDFVRAWCKEQGVSLTTGGGDVAAQAKARRQGIEETARALRYEFLARVAAETGCDGIATAHNAGDNAETALMHLIRGCGLGGLIGIPETRGRLIRPMLNVEREEILAYLTARGIPHVEDETNADLSYARNRVRRQLIPLLEDLNPQAVRHINATAARLREDEGYLNELAQLSDIAGNVVPAAFLAEAPRPLALRRAGALLARAGLGAEAAHREAALALAGSPDPSGQIDVPGGTVRREYGRLVFSRAEQTAPLPELPLKPGATCWGGWTIYCEQTLCPEKPGTPESFYLRAGDYTIRSRRAGDGLRPPHRCYKPLKKWFMENRVPQTRRARVPVLSREGRAAAAGGVGVDADFLARPGEAALHIVWKERDK